MCICSTYCLQFRLEKSGIFSVWRVITLSVVSRIQPRVELTARCQAITSPFGHSESGNSARDIYCLTLRWPQDCTRRNISSLSLILVTGATVLDRRKLGWPHCQPVRQYYPFSLRNCFYFDYFLKLTTVLLFACQCRQRSRSVWLGGQAES